MFEVKENVIASPKAKKITIIDVARVAGVSPATVSAAFNEGPVSPKTYERIMSISRRFGYRPNRIARSMVTKRTHVLGMVMDGVITELTDSATACAARLGYDLMTFFANDMGEGGEQRCVERLLERMVDGIILMPAQSDSMDYGRLISSIKDAGTEIVIIDRYFRELRIDSVVTDNYMGAFEAVRHLISLGHKRIGLLQGKVRTCSTQIDRFEGYKDALTQAGIPFDKDLLYAEPNKGDLEQMVMEMLTCKPRLTGVFATIDYLAYEVMLVCRKLGIRIPEDISLIGYDDVLLSRRRVAELLIPRLTTVRQDFLGMVKKTTEILVARIEGKMNDKCKIHYIEPELIIRDSTKMLAQG